VTPLGIPRSCRSHFCHAANAGFSTFCLLAEPQVFLPFSLLVHSARGNREQHKREQHR
jgi:hypothetical protein